MNMYLYLIFTVNISKGFRKIRWFEKVVRSKLEFEHLKSRATPKVDVELNLHRFNNISCKSDHESTCHLVARQPSAGVLMAGNEVAANSSPSLIRDCLKISIWILERQYGYTKDAISIDPFGLDGRTSITLLFSLHPPRANKETSIVYERWHLETKTRRPFLSMLS